MQLLQDGGAGDVLFVGGCVRDYLLGIPDAIKDIDIEVYGLSYEKIIAILSPHFRVDVVGKSFGTVKVDHGIDLSIPRRESKQGSGHKGFHVVPDPKMTFREAASRRDFTVNAIGMRLDNTIVDPYGGVDDLDRKILRATSDAFGEDPLRVLRGMQFSARFGFQIEPRTIGMCRDLKNEFATLSPERIWGEWFKWAVKSEFPSLGLQCLKETTWLDCFPQLFRMLGTPQHSQYHQEGDVFEHTKLTVDAAVSVARGHQLSENDRLILLFAALLHDVGKPETLVRNEDGNWTSPNHAAAGVKPSGDFFESMLAPHWVAENVKPLIREHQTRLAQETETASATATRRLAQRLSPSNIRMWAMLCQSDATGCITDRPHRSLEPWLTLAKSLGVLEFPPVPMIQGRHLLELGFSPGPEMGRLLRCAFEAQLDGEFHDLASGLLWVVHQSEKN